MVNDLYTLQSMSVSPTNQSPSASPTSVDPENDGLGSKRSPEAMLSRQNSICSLFTSINDRMSARASGSSSSANICPSTDLSPSSPTETLQPPPAAAEDLLARSDQECCTIQVGFARRSVEQRHRSIKRFLEDLRSVHTVVDILCEHREQSDAVRGRRGSHVEAVHRDSCADVNGSSHTHRIHTLERTHDQRAVDDLHQSERISHSVRTGRSAAHSRQGRRDPVEVRAYR